MAADKSILQLLAASVLNLTDNGVIVQGTNTERFELQLLIDLLSSNISLGSTITSGTTVPTGGKDTDVYIKTNSGQVYQKISGSWVVIYTFPSAGSGTTVIYGSSDPVTATGNNGDTYINTLSGKFFQKTAGTWAQVFSMATGPQGPQGTAGTNGTNGVDGNTILYGNGNPSNGLGINGNFYINTANYTFFGPKASNVWPAGVSLVYLPPADVRINYPAWNGSTGTALPLPGFTSFQTLYSAFGSNPKFQFRKIIGGGILTANINNSATSAANGTYTAQAIVNQTGLYNSTGIGTGGTATIIVSGGHVTSITIIVNGGPYYVGETFTIAAAPGAVFQVATNTEIYYQPIEPNSVLIGEVTDQLPDSVTINVDDDGTGHLQDNLQAIISK